MPFKKGHKFYKGGEKGWFKKGIKPWNKGTKGLCKSNFTSFKKGIIPWIKGKHHSLISKKIMAEKKWKGGRTKRYGYVLIFKPDHPFSRFNYIREHRLIMEKKVKRYLSPEEVVHHINGIKSDNRIKNLKLLRNEKEHRMLHKTIKVNK